jgi:hypothetical protein
MLPVAVNVPAPGSYNSAVASSPPPAMSTFPLGNNVAVGRVLASVMLPADVNVPALGSYSSALVSRPPSSPPATSTHPLDSNVAVPPILAANMLPVRAKVPVDGSYNSALALASIAPPPTSTFPLCNNVDVCCCLTLTMPPVGTKWLRPWPPPHPDPSAARTNPACTVNFTKTAHTRLGMKTPGQHEMESMGTPRPSATTYPRTDINGTRSSCHASHPPSLTSFPFCLTIPRFMSADLDCELERLLHPVRNRIDVSIGT